MIDEQKRVVPFFDPFNGRSLGLEEGAPLEETVIELSLHRLCLSVCYKQIHESRILWIWLGLGFQGGIEGVRGREKEKI